MASFNILGTCICRDLFGFSNQNEHTVKKFMQAASPVCLFGLNSKPLQPLSEENFDSNFEMNNFKKKCVIRDYNHTVLENYDEKTNYFLLDLVDIFNNDIVCEYTDDDNKHYFTYSRWFNEAYNVDKMIDRNINYKIINVNSFLSDQYLYEIIGKYISWLKNECGYLENEIIVVENYKVDNFISNKKMYSFTKYDTVECAVRRTKRAYEIFRELSPKSFFIKLPFGTFSDSEHIWGLGRLHYHKKVYEYLYEAVTAITNGCTQNKIDSMRDNYSEILLELRDYYMNQSLENYIKNNLFYSENNESVSGHDKLLCSEWKTVNWSAKASIIEGGVRLEHSNSKSTAQINLIQTIENSRRLEGKEVTLSVYARCLKTTDEGHGGEIAIINSNDYNDGKMFKRLEFTNREWKRIVLTVTMPEKDSFNGVTVCLRARAGGNEKNVPAIVEFKEPRLVIGTF